VGARGHVRGGVGWDRRDGRSIAQRVYWIGSGWWRGSRHIARKKKCDVRKEERERVRGEKRERERAMPR
jgi:hypothetical protein